VIGPLGLGDDELSVDQLDGFALEDAELDETIVFGSLPAP
jgi:hypothetical protein